MLAIFKKELKSYFHSMIGYVFMAFFLVVIGIYMFVYNFTYQVANFEYVLNSVTFVFIVLIPILTMRLMAEEKKQKTDQLLFTSGVSMAKIVLAKFFAVLALFGITMLVVCIYPLILNIFGDVPFGTGYASIFGFFIMGAAFIAIGLFISSLTDSQIIAAVISFLVLLVCYLAADISRILPTDRMSTMVITMILFIAFSYVIYLSIRKIYVATGVGVLGIVAFILLYFFKPSFYDNLLSKIVSSIAVMEPFENFCYGVISLNNIIYYLSIAALFIILTTLFVKEGLSDKARKGSVYRTGFMVVAAVLCVVVNLFASELALSVDLSSNKLYTITSDTKNFVEDLKDDITIYYVCQDGQEDASVQKIVDKYDNLNKKVKVERKDPVLYPTFTKKYTDQSVIDNSVIVVNNDKGTSKLVSYVDMFEVDSTAQKISSVDVEGQITSALDYVTNENLPNLYYTSGHGELELGATMLGEIGKQNVTANELATLTVSEIPEDCDILVINGPTADFTDAEITMLKVYLGNGGNAIVTLQYTENKMDNFYGLLKHYGIYPKDGLVVEGYGHYVSNYVLNLIPTYEQHEIVNSIQASGEYVVMPNCIGLAASDTVREGVTLSELMKTSDEAYAKVNMESETSEFEDGDINGPFDLGILAEEESTTTKKTMKLAVYSSAYTFEENIVSTGQFANPEIMTNSLKYMVESAASIKIAKTSLETSYLNVPVNLQAVLGAVFVIIIPLVIIITGLIIWLRRRKG
ncbi:MAG: Gldg family protein [Clostridium sp.]|nr:Gldg family protein [Clostridium sp.]